MSKILEETGDEIDTVRLYSDGTYKSITLEEIQEEDAKTQQIKKRKKRNKPDGSEDAHSLHNQPPNLRHRNKEAKPTGAGLFAKASLFGFFFVFLFFFSLDYV